MYHYLIVKFPVGNNEELSGHFILIVSERLVVSIGKELFRKDGMLLLPTKLFPHINDQL
jgi:hypothetical protein